jgi:hypothetical protein
MYRRAQDLPPVEPLHQPAHSLLFFSAPVHRRRRSVWWRPGATRFRWHRRPRAARQRRIVTTTKVRRRAPCTPPLWSVMRGHVPTRVGHRPEESHRAHVLVIRRRRRSPPAVTPVAGARAQAPTALMLPPMETEEPAPTRLSMTAHPVRQARMVLARLGTVSARALLPVDAHPVRQAREVTRLVAAPGLIALQRNLWAGEHRPALYTGITSQPSVAMLARCQPHAAPLRCLPPADLPSTDPAGHLAHSRPPEAVASFTPKNRPPPGMTRRQAAMAKQQEAIVRQQEAMAVLQTALAPKRFPTARSPRAAAPRSRCLPPIVLLATKRAPPAHSRPPELAAFSIPNARPQTGMAVL